jgi:hypothetical protein
LHLALEVHALGQLHLLDALQDLLAAVLVTVKNIPSQVKLETSDG